MIQSCWLRQYSESCMTPPYQRLAVTFQQVVPTKSIVHSTQTGEAEGANQSACPGETNGPSPECPTYASESRGSRHKSSNREADVERGCSRVQRQHQNSCQMGAALSSRRTSRVAGPQFAS